MEGPGRRTVGSANLSNRGAPRPALVRHQGDSPPNNLPQLGLLSGPERALARLSAPLKGRHQAVGGLLDDRRDGLRPAPVTLRALK